MDILDLTTSFSTTRFFFLLKIIKLASFLILESGTYNVQIYSTGNDQQLVFFSSSSLNDSSVARRKSSGWTLQT